MVDFQAAKDFKMLNNCQMFLQVTTLAEIANHTRTHLLSVVLKQGNITPTLTSISKSNYKWPMQPNPRSQAWTLWSQALVTVYTKPGLSTTLLSPLGEWQTMASMVQQWYATYNPTMHAIIRIKPSRQTNYVPNTTTHHHIYYTMPTTQVKLQPR